MDEERPELDFHFYFGVLRRRAWIIVVVTLLTTGVALARSLTTTKIYESSSTVLVTDPIAQTSLNSSSSAGNPVDISTETALVLSGRIAAAANKALGADAAKVTGLWAAPVGETTLISITAQSASPRVAQRAANAYASKYVSVRTQQAVDASAKSIAAINQSIVTTNAQIATLDQQINANPFGSSDLQTQKLGLQNQLVALNQQLNAAQLEQAAKRSGGAQIVDQAGLPSSPVKPDPKRDALLGLALGLVLGLGLAFLTEFLDDKIKTPEDVARYAHGLTVLAEIPTIGKERKGRRLVALDDPSSGAAEAYRSLRTSLRLISLRKPIQTLLVTSAMAGEGKTTTAANLGVTLARSGLRVVIIDLDLRRASLAPLFGGDNDIGIMSVLVGEQTLAEAMYEVPIASGVPPLRFLPAGPIPPNPSEIMGTSRMAEVLANLRATADFVIIDTPPIVPVTDAVVLSSRVDAVMMVIQAGKTRRRHLIKSADFLQQADAPMVGAVMNGAGKHAKYGYYERYGYGYGRKRKPKKKYRGVRPGQERQPRGADVDARPTHTNVSNGSAASESGNGTGAGTGAESAPQT
jgi:capsular exopolysaccharide synthesis family protein